MSWTSYSLRFLVLQNCDSAAQGTVPACLNTARLR